MDVDGVGKGLTRGPAAGRAGVGGILGTLELSAEVSLPPCVCPLASAGLGGGGSDNRATGSMLAASGASGSAPPSGCSEADSNGRTATGMDLAPCGVWRELARSAIRPAKARSRSSWNDGVGAVVGTELMSGAPLPLDGGAEKVAPFEACASSPLAGASPPNSPPIVLPTLEQPLKTAAISTIEAKIFDDRTGCTLGKLGWKLSGVRITGCFQ